MMQKDRKDEELEKFLRLDCQEDDGELAEK